VLNSLCGDSRWKRLNKPWFKQDEITEVVYRRSPASRLHPDGRTTVRIPYRLTFAITVSHHDRYGFGTLLHLQHPGRLTKTGGSRTPSITHSMRQSSQTRRYRLEDCFKIHRSRQGSFEIRQETMRSLHLWNTQYYCDLRGRFANHSKASDRVSCARTRLSLLRQVHFYTNK
jgi:hypothetical protein